MSRSVMEQQNHHALKTKALRLGQPNDNDHLICTAIWIFELFRFSWMWCHFLVVIFFEGAVYQGSAVQSQVTNSKVEVESRSQWFHEAAQKSTKPVKTRLHRVFVHRNPVHNQCHQIGYNSGSLNEVSCCAAQNKDREEPNTNPSWFTDHVRRAKSHAASEGWFSASDRLTCRTTPHVTHLATGLKEN